MKYAIVKVKIKATKTFDNAVVETCHIKDFNKYSTYTKNCVYRYNDGEEKFKCIILDVSDSKEELTNPNFRIREPVITNPSSLESSSDDDEEQQSAIDRLKEARKKQKQNVNKYKKLKTEEIVKIYNKKTENFEGKVTSGRNVDNETEQVFTNDDQMKEQNPFTNENLSDIIVNETIEEGHAELDKMSQTKSPSSIIPESDSEDDMFAETRHGHVNANVEITRNNEDGDSDSIALSANNKGHLSTSSKKISAKTTILKDRTNEDSNKLLKGLLEDNRKKDLEIAKMKAMNQKWRLEAASERKKLKQLQQQQQQQLRQQQQQPQQQPQQHQRQQRYDPYHYLDNATFDFGDGMTIPSHESRRAFDAKTPSKFMKIMSHAVWGTENLSQRVVRKQKNTRDRRQLSPRKKELLQTHYRHYLQEQNYSVEKFNIEVEEVTVNKYLDQPIQSAKKINNS